MRTIVAVALHDVAGARSTGLARLNRFRSDLYECMTSRADGLFELGSSPRPGSPRCASSEAFAASAPT